MQGYTMLTKHLKFLGCNSLFHILNFDSANFAQNERENNDHRQGKMLIVINCTKREERRMKSEEKGNVLTAMMEIGGQRAM